MKIKKVAIAILSLATVGVAWVGVSGSGLLAVGQVRVVGADAVDITAVRAASGIEPGQNVLTLDLEAAAASVEAIPLIADAVVERSGALDIVIRVIERRAAIRSANGTRTTFLDPEGVVVGPPERGSVLPTLVGPRPDADTRIALLRTWERLSSDQRKAVTFRMAPERGLILEIDDLLIVLGGPERVAEKMRTVRSLRAALKGEGKVRRIDVTDPGRPTVRMAG